VGERLGDLERRDDRARLVVLVCATGQPEGDEEARA